MKQLNWNDPTVENPSKPRC